MDLYRSTLRYLANDGRGGAGLLPDVDDGTGNRTVANGKVTIGNGLDILGADITGYTVDSNFAPCTLMGDHRNFAPRRTTGQSGWPTGKGRCGN